MHRSQQSWLEPGHHPKWLAWGHAHALLRFSAGCLIGYRFARRWRRLARRRFCAPDKELRSCGRAARFISFDIRRGSADLGADKTRSQINCFVLWSFFLSAEVWERVNEHSHCKMAVQHLTPSASTSEIDSADKKQENRRFVVTKVFAESSVSCGNSELPRA